MISTRSIAVNVRKVTDRRNKQQTSHVEDEGFFDQYQHCGERNNILCVCVCVCSGGGVGRECGKCYLPVSTWFLWPTRTVQVRSIALLTERELNSVIERGASN